MKGVTLPIAVPIVMPIAVGTSDVRGLLQGGGPIPPDPNLVTHLGITVTHLGVDVTHVD